MKLKLGFLITSFLLLKHHHEKDYIIQKTHEIFQYSIDFSEGGRIQETFYHSAVVYIAKATNSVKGFFVKVFTPPVTFPIIHIMHLKRSKLAFK